MYVTIHYDITASLLNKLYSWQYLNIWAHTELHMQINTNNKDKTQDTYHKGKNEDKDKNKNKDGGQDTVHIEHG